MSYYCENQNFLWESQNIKLLLEIYENAWPLLAFIYWSPSSQQNTDETSRKGRRENWRKKATVVHQILLKTPSEEFG